MSIKLINLNQYIRPKLVENKSKDWVLNGQNNSFYQYVIDRFNGSPTNSAIINAYVDLMYGNGLNYKNSQLQNWVKLQQVLSKKDLRKLISDFILFGECVFHVVKAKNGKDLGAIYHLPVQNIAPSIANENNEILSYWFCKDWKNTNKNIPIDFNAFGYEEKAKEHIFKLKPYKAGKEYFADPDYLSGLPYCEMEEEIANYYISHIKNGLSFGYIVNIPAGSQMTEEQQNEIERKIIQKLTGSSNAGKMVLSFNDVNGEKTTVEVVQLNDAHKQWEYLTAESRQQIMTAHRVTSPMLFGIKDSTGFGNNADELDTAEAQLYKRVIQPKQGQFLEALDEILRAYNINLDLYFRPLTEQSTSVQMSEQSNALDFSSFEDFINDDWELVATREVLDTNNNVNEWVNEYENNIQLSDYIISKPSNESNLDKSFYKVRYSYREKYPSDNHRGFCAKMMERTRNGVVYRLEDIDKASRQGLNKSFGHKGTPYDLFKFKGGVNCGHFWQEELYKLKKGREDKALSSADIVSEIPKTYIPKPSGNVQSKIAPKDMPNNGHHPNYNK